METLFDYHGLYMRGLTYKDAVKYFRGKIKEHLKENSKYYFNNVPISLKRYFDEKRKNNKMTEELEKIEQVTYELLALLDEENESEISEKALLLVGKKDIEYDDGVIRIEIYRLNDDWIRFDYWSYITKEEASIQAFNIKKSGDRLYHYEVSLYETERNKNDELLNFAINYFSFDDDKTRYL